jgi:hypothetical protein
MNKKADCKKFVEVISKYLLEKNPFEYKQNIDESGDSEFDTEKFTFLLPNENKLYITLYLDPSQHKHVYTVFCRFETPCNVGNKINGKFNLLSCSDYHTAIKEFINMFERAFGANQK